MIYNRNVARPQDTIFQQRANALKNAHLSSDDLGKIIEWGTGQAAADVAKTVARAQEINLEVVKEMVAKGLYRDWVEYQVSAYEKAMQAGGPKLRNKQLIPRLELMRTILRYWP